MVVIEVMLSATRLELESVTVCGGEMVSTPSILPNDRGVGDTVGVAMMPFSGQRDRLRRYVRIVGDND